MRVKELIELLQKENPEAFVLVTDMGFTGHDDLDYAGEQALITAIETGWSNDITWDGVVGMECDISFVLNQCPGLIPAVRLVGASDEPTDPRSRITTLPARDWPGLTAPKA